VPPIVGATAADAVAIQRIYAHHVRTGTATFETEVPSVDEMARRIAQIQDNGLPYLVIRPAIADSGAGAVLGYAYAAPFRARAAYRHTVEDSIYLAPETMGHGLGTRLLTALIDRCAAHGGLRLHQMVAVISMPGGDASVALHRRLGFQTVGRLAQVGRKHGQWLDTLYMQRAVGPGPSDD